MDGHRVDRTVNELAPSQNMPDSINADVPLVSGPHVDRAVDELSPTKNMPYSTYLTVTRVAVPRVDRAVGELFPERERGIEGFPGVCEFPESPGYGAACKGRQRF